MACLGWAIGTGCSLEDLDRLSAGKPSGISDASAGSAGSQIGSGGSIGGAGRATGGNGGISVDGSGGVGGTAGSGRIDAGDGSSSGGTAGSGGAAGAISTGAGGAAATSGASGQGGASAGGSGTAGTAGRGGTSGTAGAAGTNADGAAGTAGSGGAIDAGSDAPAAGAVFSVGSFLKSVNIGSQVVHHALGQTPKALILWTAGKTGEALSAGFYYGFGVSDGTVSGALAMSAKDGMTAAWSSRRIAPKAITLVQAGEAIVAEAELSSMSASSITLNWTTNDNQPDVVHYIALGGSEVSAKVVNWQAPTTTGTKVVTGVGFQPEAVLHFHVGAGFVSAPPASQTNGVIGMGAMNEDGAQWAIQVADATSVNPSVSTRAQRTDAAIYMYHAPSAVVNKVASFVSMDAGGFTLNFTTASSDASQVYSLALAGLRTTVGTFTKSTAAAPASQAVATPFTPGAVFLSSYQTVPQTATVRESQCSWGVGASDGTNEGSSAIVSSDAVSPTAVDGVDKTSKVFIKMNSPPMDAEADMASFDPSGFTLNWTTNDPVAAQMCFVALGAR